MLRGRTWALIALLLVGVGLPAAAGPIPAPVGGTPGTQLAVAPAPAGTSTTSTATGTITTTAAATSTGTVNAPASTTGTISAEPGTFQDLPRTHWAYGPVMQLLQSGVISRDPTGRFRPEEPIQRAELFKMALLSRRMDLRPECEGMFRDVPCSAWFAPSAETAYRMGIADGVGFDLFGPDLYVTRQQLFAVVIRALGRRWEAANQSWSEIHQHLAPFRDVNRMADWARPPLALAVNLKLAGGYTDGTFRPEAIASRAEAAALVSRILLPENGLKVQQVDGRTIAYAHAYEMKATMYATGEAGVGTTTYTGLKVRTGAIAVDPKVIPLGSLVYVEGYGYGVAADIGGSIKGNWVDLFTHSHRQAAIEFGVQQRRLWILP